MTRARRRALVLLVTAAVLIAGPAIVVAQTTDDVREVLVVEASGATLDDMLGIPAFRGMSAYGGSALLVESGLPLADALHALGADVVVPAVTALDLEEVGSLSGTGGVADRVRLVEAAGAVASWLAASEADSVLVVVAIGSPSPASAAAGDTVGVVIAATGPPGAIADAMRRGDATPFALASSSTRRDGVVVTADVVRTVRSFLGASPADAGLGGAVMRPAASPPPLELHERFLAQRRLYVPMGAAAVLYLTIAGVLACAALALGERVPRVARRVLGWMSLSVAALGTALLAAGHLPELTYATAVPFVAIVTVFGTLAVSPIEQREVTLVPAALGALVLTAFVLEAATGWDGMVTPLVGGSQLDGGRFYGMPNAALGLVIGAALWSAHPLPTFHGVAILVGVALIAGMPFLGADLGGAVTASATAGLWFAVRERARLRPVVAVAVVIAATAVGTAITLAAHAVSPAATHVTRFESDADGVGGWISTFVERLRIGFDLIATNPLALIPVVGLVVVLALVARPPAAIRATFERWPAWRDAILVCALGGVVAYVANDTGAAAAGFAFGLALGGMVGVSLLAEPGKMGHAR